MAKPGCRVVAPDRYLPSEDVTGASLLPSARACARRRKGDAARSHVRVHAPVAGDAAAGSDRRVRAGPETRALRENGGRCAHAQRW